MKTDPPMFANPSPVSSIAQAREKLEMLIRSIEDGNYVSDGEIRQAIDDLLAAAQAQQDVLRRAPRKKAPRGPGGRA